MNYIFTITGTIIFLLAIVSASFYVGKNYGREITTAEYQRVVLDLQRQEKQAREEAILAKAKITKELENAKNKNPDCRSVLEFNLRDNKCLH